MRFLLGLSLLLFVSIAAAAPAAQQAAERKPLIVEGTQRRHLADDLKAYHQEMRQTHKNYIPYYPDVPITSVIWIGTPVVPYDVSLESGSEALFVLGKDYPGRNRSANQRFFDPAQSSTAQFAGAYEGFSGDLKVSGAAYEDVVGLFGSGALYNATQRFGVVNDVEDPQWINPQMPDGVFGLSWNPNDAAHPNENSSAILNLFKEFGDVDRYWCHKLEVTNKPEYGRYWHSAMSFGHCFERLCALATPENTLPLKWLESSRSLAFMIDFFAYNEQEHPGGFAKVDSGVPHILLPYGTFSVVYEDVKPDYDFTHGIYTVDCSKAGQLPDWTFGIGGKNYSVPSSAYVVDLQLPNDQCAFSFFVSDQKTTDYVLGYVFYNFWCIKMDIDNQSISFLDVLPQSTNGHALN